MTKLPPPPPEVPASTDMTLLADLFAEKVFTIIADMKAKGHDAVVCEGFRSDARQEYLYGFGRTYDDGRGIVTQADTGRRSWHRYALAVDIISASKQWDAPEQFWRDLRNCAVELALTSGADWSSPDRPHVQWWNPGMHVAPSDHAWELLQSSGVEAVWKELRATFAREAA